MNKKNLKFKPSMPDFKSCNVCIIGLSYVGLPLAVEIAKTKKCIGIKNII